MSQLKSILFPVDFSEQCDRAAPAVLQMAEHFRAELILVHVIGIPLIPVVTYPDRPWRMLWDDLHDKSAVEMEAFLKRHFCPRLPTHKILEGDPATAIVEFAHNEQVDLVTIPTHGHGLFRRFLLGSVSSKVLHDLQCPVWTPAHSDSPDPIRTGGYKNILCAVDCDDSAIPLIRWASWVTEAYGARLRFVHVIPAMDETSQNCGERSLRFYFREHANKNFTRIMADAGCERELILRGGDIPHRLADTAKEKNIDLMIIGRGHLSQTLGRLRTHALRIIRESPCPVLSV